MDNMDIEDIQNCFTCIHCVSKNYMTIRCDIWTKKIRDWLMPQDTDIKDPEHLVGRMHHSIRCQYYEKGDYALTNRCRGASHKTAQPPEL